MTAGALGCAWLALIEVLLSRPVPVVGMTIFALFMFSGALLGVSVRLFRRVETALVATTGLGWSVGVAVVAFNGRHAQTLPLRGLYQVSIVCFGLALTAMFLWALRFVRRRLQVGRPPRSLGLLLLALGAACVLADHYALPRLYPFCHWSFRLFAVATASLAVFAFGLNKKVHFPTRLAALGGGPVAVLALLTFPALRPLVFEAGMLDGLRHLPLWSEPLGAAASIPVAKGPCPPLTYPGHDVFLLTIDALRADHVGAYGYSRPTTPVLDHMAKESVVFERAYAPMPHTSFSVMSLLTGRYLHAHAESGDSRRAETLSELLRLFRTKTAAFFPPSVFFIDREQFADYEQSACGFEYVKKEFLNADARVGQVAEFLKRQPSDQSVFVWVHYFEPHEPYTQHEGLDFGPSALDRYDSEVAATDRAIGQLFGLIRRERPLALVIVTADHGEEFGDHGGYYHGTSLYDEQVRVPLLVNAPALPPRRVAMPVSTVDLAPTLLSLLNIPPPAAMDGRDLGPWLAGEAPGRFDRGPVLAELQHKRMVVTGHHKLICDIQGGFCQLYDLVADPGERKDIATQEPMRARKLRRDLAGLLEPRTQTPVDDPVDRAVMLARLGETQGLATLTDLLDSHDLEQSRRAASALFAFAATTAFGPREKTQDVELRDRTTIARARAGDADSLAALVALIERVDLPPSMRFQAALALGEHQSAAGLQLLVEALRNSHDFEHRRAAAWALGTLRHPDAVAPLVNALADVRLRKDVATALGRIGDLRAGKPLALLLATDPYISVREAAALALGKLGGNAAKRALETSLRRERERVVLAAAQESLRLLSH